MKIVDSLVGDLATALLHGVVAGIVYSLSGYFRNRARERGEFDLDEFTTTVIQGAAIGLTTWVAAQLGIPLTLQGAENILMQAGILTLARKIYSALKR